MDYRWLFAFVRQMNNSPRDFKVFGGTHTIRSMCTFQRHSICLLLPLISLVLLTGPSVAGQESPKDAPAKVVVARVIESPINEGRRVVGTVNPLRTSTIGSAVDGRVAEFLIDHGEPVSENQPLARLRSETLEIELAAAGAELILFEQQLTELENGSRSEDIDELRAKLAGAKAAEKHAASRLTRMEKLFGSSATSEIDVDDAREQADATRFAAKAAEALLKRIEAGPRVEQIAQAQTRVQLQTHKVRLIEDRITKHTIVAPFDGFVAAKYTEVGAWISQGDPIAQVVQLDEVEIEAPTTAENAVQLRRGDRIRIEFPELPDQLFIGEFERIVPVADPRARTFPVYIRMKNQIRDGAPILLAGMLARVDLPTGQRQSVPLVTKDALVLNEKDCAVFIVDPDSTSNPKDPITPGAEPKGTVRKVRVELGIANGELIQVRGQLKSGDLVVTVGNERLRAGDKVTIVQVLEDHKSPDESVPPAAAVK